MEFPNIGQHCSQPTCNLLDFLPMKCDGCSKVFCKDHFRYVSHECPFAYKNDVQVPLCPLCNQPVPVNRNELPDISVGQHIDRDCRSNYNKRKIFTNRCSATGCKKKEMMPLKCDRCKKNFCLKHRHQADHDCGHASSNDANISHAGAAAFSRFQARSNKTSNEQNNGQRLNASMSEDEALARALQLSLMDEAPNHRLPSGEMPKTKNEDDLLLAQAIAASEEQYHKEQRNQRRNTTCCLS